MTLTTTFNYRVYIEVTRKTPETINFNIVPTVEVIGEALRRLKEDVCKQEIERLDNLVSLVRLAGTLRIPTAGQKEIHDVKVSGIYIGKVVIKSIIAWTTVGTP
jgi:hypothetical protein